MRILVEVDSDKETVQPGDWKKLNEVKNDIHDYIRLRGYIGKINFVLDSNGGDLYVTLSDNDIFSSADSLVGELKKAIPGYIFDVEED